jgi:colanic acid biosynthesis glycosyl transferase WcaI
MLRTIVCRWVSDGHDVDVLSSQPSYKAGIQSQKQPKKEVVDGANIVRLELPSEAGKSLVRILNALHLGVAVFWQAVIRKRYDVIMVSTSPPVLAGWFVALAAKLTGARFIYHCMDIHPEIGRISGEFRNPKVFSLLSRLDRWTCAQARPVVVLSEDMANTLAARKAGPSPETLVINNFSLPTESSVPSELPFPWPSEPFVLLFAGNIGRFQGLDVLIDAMGKLSVRSDIRLVMMGEGTEKDPLALKAEQIGARVSFFGHHSVDVAKLAMGRASFGFVSLVPELYHYAYPSKTMTYLEQGCPVLVAVEPESCLARDIVGNAAGLAVPGGDVDNLVEAISSLADDPDEVNSMRQNAREFAARGFALDVVLARWSFLLKEPSDV